MEPVSRNELPSKPAGPGQDRPSGFEKNSPAKKKRPRRAVITAGLVLAGVLCGAGAGILYSRNSASGSADMEKFQTVYNLMKDSWFYSGTLEDPETDLIESAISGMTTQPEDIHTSYFSLDEAQAFSQSLSGSNVGIGISFFVNGDGNLQVKDVFVNSSAADAGLQAGDIITKLNDKPAAGMSTDDLIAYIQSQEGKSIETIYLRDGQEQTASLVPGNYDSTVTLDLQDDYGLVKLTSFSENSGTAFAKALGKLKEQGVRNLILDLRDNSGGYLNAALEVSGSLVPAGSDVFVEVDKNGNEKVYQASSSFTQVPFDHIYVLQNGNSASASEVLIGALKDNLPADQITTIGTTTYGKGTEQTSMPFTDGTSLKMTVAEWKTPNRTSINKVGFEPDIEVEESAAQTTPYREMEEDEVIEPDTVGVNAQAAQIFLQYLGYPADRTDTYFSPASSEALKQFQEDSGLEATGKIDKKTFEALRDALIIRIGELGREDDQAFNKALEEIKNS